MPSKNDLSALKAVKKPAILPANDGEGRRVLIDPPPASDASGRIGRPPKRPAEKRSYKVTLSLTPAEGRKLAEKAGLAGEATYLYAFLTDNGLFD